MLRLLSTSFLIVSCHILFAQEKILMFVSHEETYYSEYIVMKLALETSGYEVDVVSSHEGEFSIYMFGYPDETVIQSAANELFDNGYTTFKDQFFNLFGGSWNETYNSLMTVGDVDARIQDIQDMSEYVGLIVVGGTGALNYRVDGSYEIQGQVTSEEVMAAAEQLNDLALEALLSGKPVMAQCHGASIPAFWRIPGTGDLGTSLLEGQQATGFPEEDTCPTLNSLGVLCRSDDRVVVASPNEAFNDNGSGDSRIITTRDWYPQTVAYAARTFLNIIETYPSKEEQSSVIEVLVLHGGALDDSNVPTSCDPVLNRDNDIPCNHGSNLPADYTHVMDLLAYQGDGITINATDLNMATESIPSDLSIYDVVVFYKHWSTHLTDEIMQRLVDYVDMDNGSRVVYDTSCSL